MRFKSKPSGGYTVYAVAGVHSISFAIDFTKANTKGLLGFAVERYDPHTDERYYLHNAKVFQELVPHPDPTYWQTSFDHPIQSFVWDDFSVKPGFTYEYFFYPCTGKPKHLKRSTKPIRIKIKTELEYDKKSEHDIFFNRGVASSQAYARRFDNKAPNEIKDKKLRGEAEEWLSRGLDEGLVAFIRQAKKGDGLYACFYEFHFSPVIDEFRKAIKRGVDVRIIYDAKDNSTKKEKAFPRDANQAAMKGKIPASRLIKRESNKSYIQHNKFIVYLKGKSRRPTSVWTGSTNISEGGIFGQTNVGHWVRNEGVAQQFIDYWTVLSDDPGSPPKGAPKEGKTTNATYKKHNAAIQPDLEATTAAQVPDGVTCMFSPRPDAGMLTVYAQLLDNANRAACITLAFGINKVIKGLLKDNTSRNAITLMLLEKEDKATDKNRDVFVKLGSRNNVYQAYGAYMRTPLYQWTREVTTQHLGLNSHVKYVHTKFMLVDPLAAKPLVVSGSANFSEPSIIRNDENMLLIKGDHRVADIYFTEFMRLFTHYYFRSVFDQLSKFKAKTNSKKSKKSSEATVFLSADDSWLKKYGRGKFRRKRVEMFARMAGAKTMR